MKELFILLALMTTQTMASSLFTAEELAKFETHNFKMPTTLEEKRAIRPNRTNPMVHEFRTGRATRTVKTIVARATRPNRCQEVEKAKNIKLAQLF
jgi:hypothetical protein